MDRVNLYWTIIVGIISAGWVVVTFLRDNIAKALERNKEIVTRLLEDDKLIIENPDIQMYLSENAKQDVAYFRNEAVLGDALFFKAKSLAYKQLSMFDEILSVSSMTSRKWPLLNPPSLIEMADWETYIKLKLRHPLYQSILRHESNIFGESLRSFWGNNKKDIISAPIDPFIW